MRRLPTQEPRSPASRATEAHELGALLDVAAQGFADVVSRIEELHEAVAARSFGAAGAVALPARAVHDAIAGAVYATVRVAGTAVGTAGAFGARLWPGGAHLLSRTNGGGAVLGALNGVIGDRLEHDANALRVAMAVRHQGSDVALEPDALARAFPDATGRLVVFAHGLCETEAAWRLRAGEEGVTYGSRLAEELGYTPVYVRYNTGLHVSENGRRLADLLERLVTAWPAPLDDLALVGHSMGGLVARSAGHVAQARGDTWVSHVCAIVCLGTPHLGSPVEKAANVAGWALRVVPETAPAAAVLEARSAGIKDLRFGYLVDDDWREADPDALMEDRRSDVPLLETAGHHVVAATVTDDLDHPLGRALGDLLVRSPSAFGSPSRGRPVPFPPEERRHIGGAGHLALLNHPGVYVWLRDWLAPSPRAPAHEGGRAPARR